MSTNPFLYADGVEPMPYENPTEIRQRKAREKKTKRPRAYHAISARKLATPVEETEAWREYQKQLAAGEADE